jgi:hypothetical protein
VHNNLPPRSNEFAPDLFETFPARCEFKAEKLAAALTSTSSSTFETPEIFPLFELSEFSPCFEMSEIWPFCDTSFPASAIADLHNSSRTEEERRF